MKSKRDFKSITDMAEINKIHIGNEKISSRQSKQLMLEMNYIMPDNKPRINSIAHTTVKPVISATNLVGDTVNFNISADCMILYNALSVSEEEEHLFTTSCEFSKTFKESIMFDDDDNSSVAESKSYSINIHQDNVETVLISDRKVIVKAYVTVSAVSKQTVGIDAVESFDDDSIVTKTGHIDSMRSVGIMRVQSFVKEDVTLDGSLPAVDVIIHKDAAVQIDNQRTADGKAIFYGTVHVDVVYSNMDSSPRFYSAGFDVNFNQACEIPDVSENAVLNITPNVTELTVDPKENGVMGIEALISFDVEVYDYFTYDITQDAFLPGMQLELKTENAESNDTFILSNNVGICSEKLSSANDDVETVLFSSVYPKECNSYIEGKNIYFDGVYSIESMYVPKSDANIIKAASAEIPYSYMFEAQACNGEVIDCSVAVKSVTAQVNDYGEIVLKWVAGANATVMEKSEYSVITSAQAKQLDVPEEKAIYYHFIGENEKVWDVAKHFRVSPETLCKMNGLENEEDISSLKGVVVIKY